MKYNYKNRLSICHGFQITYFMSPQFSIALIIKYIETFNREVKENTSFVSNASKFGILLSTNILLALLAARWNMQNHLIKIIIRSQIKIYLHNSTGVRYNI